MAVRDPFAVLGVPHDTGDQAVRDAYVAGVRAHPPEGDPAAFQRVREAYEVLCDRRSRARLRLFGAPPVARLEDILDEGAAAKRYAGPGAWLAVLGWRAPPRGGKDES